MRSEIPSFDSFNIQELRAAEILQSTVSGTRRCTCTGTGYGRFFPHSSTHAHAVAGARGRRVSRRSHAALDHPVEAFRQRSVPVPAGGGGLHRARRAQRGGLGWR